MWDTQFAPMHALNFGVGGERVENVLWRVTNGEMDQMNPKVSWLMSIYLCLGSSGPLQLRFQLTLC